MKITKELTASKISEYLHREITQADLVSWAEDALMEGEFEESQVYDLREVVSKLGLADVKVFGLTWEDCEKLLSLLGYKARIDVVEVTG